MSLFDQLVDEALVSRADLTTLRPVVEKELLHHDILRELADAGLLTGLSPAGGATLGFAAESLWDSRRINPNGIWSHSLGLARGTRAYPRMETVKNTNSNGVAPQAISAHPTAADGRQPSLSDDDVVGGTASTFKRHADVFFPDRTHAFRSVAAPAFAVGVAGEDRRFEARDFTFMKPCGGDGHDIIAVVEHERMAV